MGFDMDGVYPSVTRLQVHDDGGQLVYYGEGDAVTEVLNKESRTTLTEWFATNLADPSARGHTYLEFPQHYTWSKNTKRWSKRKRNDPAVGRMYNTLPGEQS
jgi:hypothetical protein